jgi:hypothetical protein
MHAAVPGANRRELLDAISAARHIGIAERDVVVASVFTTQSVTAVLEKMRDQLPSLGAPAVSFNLGAADSRTNFALAEITGITLSRQIGVSPPVFDPVAVDLESLRFFPGAVGGIVYGTYSSLDYLVHPGEYIPPIGTRTGTPVVRGMHDVYFNVIYPSGTPPAGGWPVAIYGHGAEGNKDEWMARVASALAARGIATVGINTVATGFGPLSTIFSAVEPAVGASVINVPGASIMEHTRLSAVGGRRREGLALAARRPSLLNSPGVKMLDGVEVPAAFWFENKLLRDGSSLMVALADGSMSRFKPP